MQSTLSRRYQQLQPEDRVTLASLVQQNFDVREMALSMGRSASVSARACAQQRRKHGRSPSAIFPKGHEHRVVTVHPPPTRSGRFCCNKRQG